MPVISAQTRNQLEKSIGYNLGALYVGETTDSGDTTSVIDTALWGATNERKGQWVHITDTDTSGPVGEVRRVQSNDTTVDMTMRTGFTKGPVNASEYFLWDEDYNPADIWDYINQSIRTITRKGAPPTSDVTLHTGGNIRSFAVPSTVVGIQRVQHRMMYTGLTVNTCGVIWDNVDTDVTGTVDNKDYRQHVSSCRFEIGSGLDTGDFIATDDFTAINMSGMTHLEFWLKSTVALTAGDLQMCLDNTAQCASAVENLDVPATSADTWTFHRVVLANPESDSGIISIGLKDKTDIGASTVWVDGVNVMRDNSGVWEDVNRFHWTLNRSARELELDETAISQTGYGLLRLIGFKKPTELTTDTTECDIIPDYIISKATAIAYNKRGDRRADRRDASYLQADRWEARAERALLRQATPSNTRWVD